MTIEDGMNDPSLIEAGVHACERDCESAWIQLPVSIRNRSDSSVCRLVEVRVLDRRSSESGRSMSRQVDCRWSLSLPAAT